MSRAVGTRAGAGAACDVVVWAAAAAGVVALLAPATRPVLGTALAVAVLLATVLAWPSLRAPIRVTVAAMIVAGIALVVVAGARRSDVGGAFVTMCTIFSFVAVVRLLELPMLRRGNHAATANTVLAVMRRTPPVWSSAALTYLLVLPLSFGAVPLAYRSVRAMDGAADESGSAALVCRAFITANFITPLSPPLAVALAATGLSWAGFLPYAAVLCVVAAALVPIGPRPSARPAVALGPRDRALTAEFAGLVAVVLAVLVAAELGWHLGHTAATVLAVLVVVPLWDVATGGRAGLAGRAVRSARAEAASWREQFVLFGAGGFLVAAAVRWSADGSAGRLLTAAGLAPWALLAAGALAITVLALVGLYPLTSLIVVATVLTPMGDGGWPVLVAATVLVGTAVGFVVSPFSGLNLLVAALSGRSSFDLGLRWNLPFGAGLLTAGLAVVTVLAVT